MRPFSSRQKKENPFFAKGSLFFVLSTYIFYLQQSACLLLVFNIVFTKTRSIIYTSPTMDGAWLIIVSLKWFSLPQPNQRIPYIFGITLILEAQSDKTPVINVLLFLKQIQQKNFTLHLFLGIPCVYRGFRGRRVQFHPSSPFMVCHFLSLKLFSVRYELTSLTFLFVKLLL